MSDKKRKVCRSEMAMTAAKMQKVFKRVQQFYLMTAVTCLQKFKLFLLNKSGGIHRVAGLHVHVGCT